MKISVYPYLTADPVYLSTFVPQDNYPINLPFHMSHVPGKVDHWSQKFLVDIEEEPFYGNHFISHKALVIGGHMLKQHRI
jgi:hypothetical protein